MTATAIEHVAASRRIAPRAAAHGGDQLLLTAVGLLLFFGILAIVTSSTGSVLQLDLGSSYFLYRHLAWLAIGACAFSVTAAVDYRLWQRFSVLLFFGTVVLLVLLVLFAGPIHGSNRWLLPTGSIQPSELAKLTVIIYIADWLSERRNEIRAWTLGIVPYSILVGIVCGLIIMQRDYSTAVLVLAVAAVLFFVAGAQLNQMLIGGSAAGFVLLGFLLSEQYRVDRVRMFLNPESDPYNAGWQVLRALESFRSGGWVGVGLGNGEVKHGFPLGTAHTDAIFAVIAEETGVLGCLIVIGLFGVVAWRGYLIAAGAGDRFRSLLAVGITTWIILQALINMAVSARLVPFTGITMPFVSYGGSSLITVMAGIGLLHQIAVRGDPAQARFYVPLDLRRRNGRTHLSRHHRSRRVRRTG